MVIYHGEKWAATELGEIGVRTGAGWSQLEFPICFTRIESPKNIS